MKLLKSFCNSTHSSSTRITKNCGLFLHVYIHPRGGPSTFLSSPSESVGSLSFSSPCTL